MINIIIFAILLTSCAETRLDCTRKREWLFNQYKHSSYGVLATESILDDMAYDLSLPKLSKTKKSMLTVNKYGFDIIHTSAYSELNWVVQEYLKSLNPLAKPVLEIGAGYGALAYLALMKGVNVIYNDMALEHLLLGRKFIKEKVNLKKLYLNNDRFPHRMNLPSHSISAILMHRVLHFLKPEEVELGIQKAAQWLVPQGCIYIVVMSPTHVAFRDKFLPIYNKKWLEGHAWPGYPLPVKEALPDQAYHLPSWLHVMDARPLKQILAKNHFRIIKEGFVSLNKFGTESNRDGKEAIGLIACKSP